MAAFKVIQVCSHMPHIYTQWPGKINAVLSILKYAGLFTDLYQTIFFFMKLKMSPIYYLHALPTGGTVLVWPAACGFIILSQVSTCSFVPLPIHFTCTLPEGVLLYFIIKNINIEEGKAGSSNWKLSLLKLLDDNKLLCTICIYPILDICVLHGLWLTWQRQTMLQNRRIPIPYVAVQCTWDSLHNRVENLPARVYNPFLDCREESGTH